jgi:hypothetical protein
MDDAWGTPFRYGAPALTGQLVSAGPDLMFGTADDISYPNTGAAVNINGLLLVHLLVWDNVNGVYHLDPSSAVIANLSATVGIYYANNGAQNGPRNVVSGAAGPYAVCTAALTQGCNTGVHAIVATVTSSAQPNVTGQATVFIPPNGQQTVVTLSLH